MYPELEIDYSIEKLGKFTETEIQKIYKISIYDFFKRICFLKFSKFVDDEHRERSKKMKGR